MAWASQGQPSLQEGSEEEKAKREGHLDWRLLGDSSAQFLRCEGGEQEKQEVCRRTN